MKVAGASTDAAVHPDAQAAFDAMAAGFDVAVRRVGWAAERSYVIAGRTVRCRVADPELAERVNEPWSHLAVVGGQLSGAELAIDLWDERHTGVLHDPRADVAGPSPRFPFQASADGDLVGHRLPGILAWLDRRRDRVIACVPDGAGLSVHERGRLVESALLFWLRDRGVQLLHGAFVSCGDDGVLLVGPSGAGKSTCALACLGHGFDFLGDDKVAVVADGETPAVGWSLTGAAYVEAADLGRFPVLTPHAITSPEGGETKAVVLLSRVPGVGLRAHATIRALAVVGVARDGRGAVSRTLRRDALIATVLGTLGHLPIDSTRSLGNFGALVGGVPCYALAAGPDPREIAERVMDILDDAARSGRT